MFNHILKLIWKKRKSNALMMLEIFFSFLILFAVWSLTVYTWRNYAQPKGLNSERVWVMYLNFNADEDSLRNQARELTQQEMARFKEIESFAFVSSNAPYSFSTMNSSFEVNGKSHLTDIIAAGDNYDATLGIELKAGRWFEMSDTIGKNQPVVINRVLAENMFGREDPIGKTIGSDDNQRVVVGVVDYFRHKSSFQPDENVLFQPMSKWETDVLLRVAPGAGAAFEARLTEAMHRLGKDWNIEVQHLDDMRATQDKFILVPILILFIVCGFLVFNVALGLFGVLFQNINRRKGEIGLRRAIGATQKQVMQYFIGETLVIAGFGLALGVFFAVQIPLLNVFDVETSTYLWAIVLAIASIVVIAVVCALYPSRQAAVILPAVALHEE